MQRFVFRNRVVNTRNRRKLKFKKEVYISKDFKVLWDKINHLTRYRVTFDTTKLIERAVKCIKELEKIKPAHIITTWMGVDITYAGVSTDRKLEEKSVLPVA